jgi:hypothetical protein
MSDVFNDPFIGWFATLGLLLGVAWAIEAVVRVFEERDGLRQKLKDQRQEKLAIIDERDDARVRCFSLSCQNLELEFEIKRLSAQMQAPLGAGYRAPAGDYAIPEPLTHSNVTLIQGGGAVEYQ